MWANISARRTPYCNLQIYGTHLDAKDCVSHSHIYYVASFHRLVICGSFAGAAV